MVTTPAALGEVGSHDKRSGVVSDNLLRNIALEFEKGPVEDLKSVVAKAQIESERESLEKQLEDALRAAEAEISRIKDSQPDADVSGLTAAANALAFALEDVKLAKNTGTLPTVTANFANTVLSKFESEHSSAKANATFMDGAAGAEYYNEVVAQYILAPGGRMDQRREFHRETTSNVRNILGSEDYERHYSKFAKAADKHFDEADRWRDKAKAAFADGNKVDGYGHTATALTHQAKGLTSHGVGLEYNIWRLEKKLDGLNPESDEYAKTREQIARFREAEEQRRAEFERARAETELALRNQANALVEKGQLSPQQVDGYVAKHIQSFDEKQAEERKKRIEEAPPEFQQHIVISRAKVAAEAEGRKQNMSGEELKAHVKAATDKALALYGNPETRDIAISNAISIDQRIQAERRSTSTTRATTIHGEEKEELAKARNAAQTDANYFSMDEAPEEAPKKTAVPPKQGADAGYFMMDEAPEAKAKKAAKEVVSASEETKQVSKAESAKEADTGKLAVKSTLEGEPSKVAAAKKEAPTV
ncbi:MAG: hypothetical protein MRY32_06945 [Rickettsiales bacterium]|nr:hypothetical protein [Rickettsiales bacterium]